MAAVSAPTGQYQAASGDRVLYGSGRVEELPALVDELGAKRAFVITGRSLATKTDLVQRLERLLGERHVGTFAETKQHVPSQEVIEAARQARGVQADILISFGGGSPVDCTKLVALALTEDWTDAAQLNARADRTSRLPPARPPLPQIAVTTTLSAAEFRGSAGVTNEETGFKGGYAHASLAPKVVVLDPDVTLATPGQLWASTGIKALDHAVERLYAPNRQPLTIAVCRETIRLLTSYLPASVAEGADNLGERGHPQIAAWLSTFSPGSATFSLSHAIGHQLGARCGVPHGVTSCITMPHAIRYVGRRWPDRLSDLAPAFGVPPDAPDPGQAVGDRVSSFVAELGLPGTLREAGVAEAQIGPLAAAAAHELKGRDVATEDDLHELLVAAW